MKERAKRTCPKGIYIAQSSLRFGGLGAWTRVHISKHTYFGPYEGKRVDKNDFRNLAGVFDGGYAWEVSCPVATFIHNNIYLIDCTVTLYKYS